MAAEYLSPSIAWTKLNGVQQQTIDFARIANQESYSVEMGHQLLEVSLPLESNEINDIYELSRHEPMPKSGMIERLLNEMPERCFTTASDGTVHVRVIGWGQWADFLQRTSLPCHSAKLLLPPIQMGSFLTMPKKFVYRSMIVNLAASVFVSFCGAV